MRMIVTAAMVLAVWVCTADAQCTCPDGSTPTFNGGVPCSGGPPAGADCPPPPGGGGGAAPGGGGAAPGGGAAVCEGSPCPASLLGDVGLTTVTGIDARSSKSFPVGENIYGPFEAGFSAQQNFILEGLGCADGNDGHVIGGIDTNTAEQLVAHQCSITLPRCSSGAALPCPSADSYISLLDECGGHTNEYHFHERLACLYDETAAGHSPRIGTASDGKAIYGKWEVQPTDPSDPSSGTLPVLDACGGQFGVTPDSNGASVYHYQVQDSPPFTIGCFGPAADGGLVSVEECRSLYDGCGDDDVLQLTTSAGTISYDPWCPCWDADGSNVVAAEPAGTPTSPPEAAEDTSSDVSAQGEAQQQQEPGQQQQQQEPGQQQQQQEPGQQQQQEQQEQQQSVEAEAGGSQSESEVESEPEAVPAVTATLALEGTVAELAGAQGSAERQSKSSPTR
jgi:hypothetical protein